MIRDSYYNRIYTLLCQLKNLDPHNTCPLTKLKNIVLVMKCSKTIIKVSSTKRKKYLDFKSDKYK